MTPTERAREMLKLGSSSSDYAGVCHETGLAMSSVIVLASRMRRDGLLPRIERKRYIYTATHMKTGALITFKSLYAAERQGFHHWSVQNAIAKRSKEYCGYRWERKELEPA